MNAMEKFPGAGSNEGKKKSGLDRRAFLRGLGGLGVSAAVSGTALGQTTEVRAESLEYDRVVKHARELLERAITDSDETSIILEVREDGTVDSLLTEGEGGAADVDLTGSFFTEPVVTPEDIAFEIQMHNHPFEVIVNEPMFELEDDGSTERRQKLLTGPSWADMGYEQIAGDSLTARGLTMPEHKRVKAVVDAGGIWLHRKASLYDWNGTPELERRRETYLENHNRLHSAIREITMSLGEFQPYEELNRYRYRRLVDDLRSGIRFVRQDAEERLALAVHWYGVNPEELEEEALLRFTLHEQFCEELRNAVYSLREGGLRDWDYETFRLFEVSQETIDHLTTLHAQTLGAQEEYSREGHHRARQALINGSIAGENVSELVGSFHEASLRTAMNKVEFIPPEELETFPDRIQLFISDTLDAKHWEAENGIFT